MKIQHFFLGSDAPVPERLREAFLELEELAATELQARVCSLSATDCLFWLTSADAHWSANLLQIRQIQPGARVVLLSNAPEPPEGLDALNQGIRGYAHAYAVPALLQAVALVVAHDGLWVGPELLQRLVGSVSAAFSLRSAAAAEPVPVSNAWAVLSAREGQVAKAVTAGRSNKEIAAQLFISERTVKAHLGAVFEKLNVRDRLQMVLHLSLSVPSLA